MRKEEGGGDIRREVQEVRRFPGPGTVRRTAGGLAAGGLLLLSFCLSLHPISTPDFYWQLKAGDWILQERAIPRTDPFSYTAADRTWVDLHWGFQSLLSLAYRWVGLDGVILLKAIVVVATLATVLAGFGSSPTSPAALCVGLLVVLASHERFLLRPEVASFLLLVLFLALIERGVRPGRRRLLLLLVPGMVLWVNLHALFILGLAVSGLAAAGDLADRVRSRWDPIAPSPGPAGGTLEAFRLPGLFAACAAACLLNPFGYRAFSLPLLQLGERIAPGGLYSRTIAEFQQPFDPSVGTSAIVAGWGIWAAGLVLLGARGRRLPTRHLLLFLAFSFLAYRARRNLPLLALAAAPGMLRALRGFRWKRTGPRLRERAGTSARVAVLLVSLLLVAAVCTNRFYLWNRMARKFGSGTLDGLFPASAVDFILRSRLPGRIFHTQEDGGFLLWRAFPERRVFIDSRLEVYEEGIYRTYLAAQGDPSVFERVSSEEGIGVVLWNHSFARSAQPLLVHLLRSENWVPVYLDAVSLVFRSVGPAGPPGGSPPGIDLESLPADEILERGRPPPTPLERWIRRVVPWRLELPVAEVRLGLLHAYLGIPRQGEPYLLRAAGDPGAPLEVHFDLGLLYEALGLTEKAILEYEEARMAGRFFRDPLSWIFRRGFRRTVHLRLGEAYLRANLEDRGREMLNRAGPRGRARLLSREGYRLQEAGDTPGAIEKYRAALREDPEQPDVLHNLGLALIADAVSRLDDLSFSSGRLEEAVRAFQEAVRIQPDLAPAHFNLGVIRLQRGRLGEAIPSLREAVRLDPGHPDYRFQLGSALERTGRLAEAAAAYSEAARLRPDFPEARFRLGRVLRGLGRYEQSRETFRQCLALGMEDPRLFLELARVSALLGDQKEALRWLSRVPLRENRDREALLRIPELAPLVPFLPRQ